MKVLLAIDDIPSSADAVDLITSKQWPPDTTVRVLSVARQESPSRNLPAPRQAQREVALRGDDVTARVVDLLEASGFLADSVVRFGESDTAIIEEAKGWSADLIIMSGHYNGVTQGGTSNESVQRVVSHAPCRVQLVFT